MTTNVSRDLNVTPMLDVMLTLIIIFIFLAQQFIMSDVQVHDPSVRGPGDRAVVTLVAGPDETLWLAGREIAPAALAAAVKGAPVEVSAQSGTRYQDVVHALDMARGAGARVLGLANKR
jgi:biopolymer transport protein ExbD